MATESQAKHSSEPSEAQTLGSVLFACVGVDWLIVSVMTMVQMIVESLTLDNWSVLKLVGVVLIAAIPVALSCLTIVHRSRLAGGSLLKGLDTALSSAPLAVVGIRGVGLCLVLHAADVLTAAGAFAVTWQDASSQFMVHQEGHHGLFRLLLGTLLFCGARWLVDRLRTKCDIWKLAPNSSTNE